MRRALPVLLLCLALLPACATQKEAKAKARAQKKVEYLAIKHYHQGIDAYTNSRYAEAIQHWKKTLELKPDHPNVVEYIDRAEKASSVLKPAPKTAKK